MSNYFQSSFKIDECHIEGCQFDIVSTQKSLFSIGNDDVLCQYSLNQQPLVTSIQNKTGHQFCILAINPANQNHIVVGTTDGYVMVLEKTQNSLIINSSKVIYKTSIQTQQSKIRSLVFTQNGKFLLIATNQLFCIVYDCQLKKFFKHKLQNQTEISSITVDYRNLFFCIIDFQAKASIYKLEDEQQVQKMQIQGNSDSEDPFAQMNTKPKEKTMKFLVSYKTSTPNLMKRNNYLKACFSSENSFLTQTLYLPGQTSLQKLELNLPPVQFSTSYGLVNGIYHTKEILQVQWLKNQKGGLILTSTQIQLTLWHQKNAQKLFVFNLQSLIGKQKTIKNICHRPCIQNQNWGFAFIAKSLTEQTTPCKVYDFKDFAQLDAQINRKIISIENNNQNQRINQPEPQQQSRKTIISQKRVLREQSKADKLLPNYLQMSMTSAYQKYNNARFLFYNNVGCIIQRTDGHNDSLLELQFHDRSKISRIKLPSQKQFEYFALCSDTLVYASTSTIYFQCEKYLKQNFTWEYQWEDIQGITIGGQWIAAVNKGDIKVFDWVGNQIHSIAFDRKFVTLAAYEDLLVIVYHSNLPMWGVQSFKMLIYQVTSKSIKCIKDVMVPSKPHSALKWFGFSEEGMICCQDQAESLRIYNFDKDQWNLTLSFDPLVEKLFIQHIQNYEVYGFKLEQRFPNEPRVLPRSLPRKIPFDLSNFKIDYLLDEQNKQIKKHKLSMMWLEHEKFRNVRWYKYKYSRKKENNRWYERNQSIKNKQEIKAGQAQLDFKLLQYLRKYLKINKNSDDQTIWKKVLILCSSLAYYNQTRKQMSQILSQAEISGKPNRQTLNYVCPAQNPEIVYKKNTKLSQLDRLEEMMGLSWTSNIKDFSETSEPMEIEN